jgi:hypothetical protein
MFESDVDALNVDCGVVADFPFVENELDDEVERGDTALLLLFNGDLAPTAAAFMGEYVCCL